MGGGGGSSVPSSAPEVEADEILHEANDFPIPDFLSSHIGQGRYNIGIVGPSGNGKSSLLNDILGANLARSGATECTLIPASYELPLDDPRGHFQKFIERLPDLHQQCVSCKLRSVTLWDLPGAGTRLHPADSYICDKGLRYFDYIICFLGERVVELDHDLLSHMTQWNIKHLMCRSKLDVLLNTHLKEKKDELGRKLSQKEKLVFAQMQMENVRQAMVLEMHRSVPQFHGQLYLLSAMQKVDDEGPNYEVICSVQEAQIVIDKLLLDVIEDRHGHDLRKFFNASLYGQASRLVLNWVFGSTRSSVESIANDPAASENDSRIESTSSEHIGESASQVLPIAISVCSSVGPIANDFAGIGNSSRVEATSSEDVGDSASQMLQAHDAGRSTVDQIVNETPAIETNLQIGPRHEQARNPASRMSPDVPLANNIGDANSETNSETWSFILFPSTDGEPRCFMPDTIFALEGGRFIQASQLCKGDRVSRANGNDVLTVRSVSREETKHVVHLRTADAFLKVTPNHRITIPSSRQHEITSPDVRDVRAKDLRVGDDVICNGVQSTLVAAELMEKASHVFAITFDPDESVEAFSKPGVIHSKGVKHSKSRRGNKRSQNGSDIVSIPDTDEEVGVLSNFHVTACDSVIVQTNPASSGHIGDSTFQMMPTHGLAR